MSTGATGLHRRALLGLPVTEWARRMRRGSISLGGHIEPAALLVGGWPLRLAGGRLSLEAEFLGGRVPTLLSLELVAPLSVEAGEVVHTGGHLRLVDQRLLVDGVDVPSAAGRLGSGRLLEALVRRLADVEVRARAEPEGDVVLSLGGGVEVCVADGVCLTVDAAAEGPADDLRLCRPVELRFGGEGIRLNHGRLEWLSRLASVRVARARLHPDGSVDLEGRGGRGFDAAVKSGLNTASAGLSALVRRSPGVRRFLRLRAGDA